VEEDETVSTPASQIGGDFFDDIPDTPRPSFDRTSPGGQFGAPRSYGGHTGADFPWAEGEGVGLPRPGRVRSAGYTKGYGNRVEVDHDDGTRTTYSHLSKIGVAQGDDLDTGSYVGDVGHTGHSHGNHLHYEVLKGGRKVNPLGTDYVPVRGAKDVIRRNDFFADVPDASNFFADLPDASPNAATTQPVQAETATRSSSIAPQPPPPTYESQVIAPTGLEAKAQLESLLKTPVQAGTARSLAGTTQRPMRPRPQATQALYAEGSPEIRALLHKAAQGDLKAAQQVADVREWRASAAQGDIKAAQRLQDLRYGGRPVTARPLSEDAFVAQNSEYGASKMREGVTTKPREPSRFFSDHAGQSSGRYRDTEELTRTAEALADEEARRQEAGTLDTEAVSHAAWRRVLDAHGGEESINRSKADLQTLGRDPGEIDRTLQAEFERAKLEVAREIRESTPTPQDAADLLARQQGYDHSTNAYKMFVQPFESLAGDAGRMMGNVVWFTGKHIGWDGARDVGAYLKRRAELTQEASGTGKKDLPTGYKIGRTLLSGGLDIAKLVTVAEATGFNLATVMAGESVARNLDKDAGEQVSEATKAYLMGKALEIVPGAAGEGAERLPGALGTLAREYPNAASRTIGATVFGGLGAGQSALQPNANSSDVVAEGMGGALLGGVLGGRPKEGPIAERPAESIRDDSRAQSPFVESGEGVRDRLRGAEEELRGLGNAPEPQRSGESREEYVRRKLAHAEAEVAELQAQSSQAKTDTPQAATTPETVLQPQSAQEAIPTGKVYEVKWADGRAVQYFDNLEAAQKFHDDKLRLDDEPDAPRLIDTPKGARVKSDYTPEQEAETGKLTPQSSGQVDEPHHSIQPRDESGQFRKITTADLREAREQIPGKAASAQDTVGMSESTAVARPVVSKGLVGPREPEIIAPRQSFEEVAANSSFGDLSSYTFDEIEEERKVVDNVTPLPSRLRDDTGTLARGDAEVDAEAHAQHREAVRAGLINAFRLSDEKADGVMAIVDARARAWGKENNRPAGEYYRARFGSIERGEEGLRTPDGSEAKGLTKFMEDARAILRGFRKADVSSAAHEIAHVFRRDLSPELLKGAEDALGVKNGEWTPRHEERFARGFERYLRDGKYPDVRLQRVFESFKNWLTEIYPSIRSKTSPLHGALSPELTKIFDKTLGGVEKGDYGQLIHNLHKAPDEGTPPFLENAQVKRALGLKADASTADVRAALTEAVGKPRSSHLSPEDITTWADSKNLQGDARKALEFGVERYNAKADKVVEGEAEVGEPNSVMLTPDEQLKARYVYEGDEGTPEVPLRDATGSEYYKRNGLWYQRNPEGQGFSAGWHTITDPQYATKIERWSAAAKPEILAPAEKLVENESQFIEDYYAGKVSDAEFIRKAKEAGLPRAEIRAAVADARDARKVGGSEKVSESVSERTPAPVESPSVEPTPTPRVAINTRARRDGNVARLSIRPSEYRGQEGFTISGRNEKGQSVSIFSKTREQAELLKAAAAKGDQAEISRILLAKSEQPTQTEVRRSVKVEKVSARTGLTKTQEGYLAGELERRVPEFGKEIGRNITIKVPGDGEFQLKNRDAANKLHQKITGKPIEGFEKAQGATVSRSPAYTSLTAKERANANTDVHAVIQAYGGAEKALKALQAQKELYERDPEAAEQIGGNTHRVDELIQEIQERVDANRSVEEVRAPLAAKVNARISAHAAFKDLKATIDRMRQRAWRGDKVGFAKETASLEPDFYLDFSPPDYKTAPAKRINELQRQIRHDEDLPLTKGFGLRRNYGTDWFAIERQAKSAESPNILYQSSESEVLKRFREATARARNSQTPVQKQPAAREARTPSLPAEPRSTGRSDDPRQIPLAPDMVAKKRPSFMEQLADAANVPRSIKSSIDLSAAMRQGAMFTLTHPLKASQIFFGAQLRSLSNKGYESVKSELAKDPDAKLMKQSGLHLTSLASDKITNREEAFASRLAGKLPLVQRTEHAYVAFLDSARSQWFKQLARQAEGAAKKTGRNVTKAQYEAIAKFVNRATGRGDLGHGAINDAAPLLNSVFFAPRYAVSKLQVLDPRTYSRLPAGARKTAVREAVQYFATVATTAMLLKYGLGAQVGTDPEDSDFLKVKVGNTRYDLTAGSGSYVVFAARVAKNLANRATDEKDEHFKDLESNVKRFLRYKLAPVPAAALNTYQKRDAVGKETSVGKEALGLITPLYLQDLYDAFKQEGMSGVAKTTPGFIGVGVQTYDDNSGGGRTTVSRPSSSRKGTGRSVGARPNNK
jgi:murein DD-endopeptidase MepM/ murein hydrolase activator NlpD